MEKIQLEGTPKTPKVVLDPEGMVELEGRSIPEHSIQFYEPIYKWLEEYSKNPKQKTTVNIKLEYFNTSSSKCIMDIFKKLQNIHDAKNEITVNWYYEFDDDDMKETGEDYSEMVGIPFQMKEEQEIF